MLFTPKNHTSKRFEQYNKPTGVKKISFGYKIRTYRWFKIFAFILVLALAVPAFLLTGGIGGKTGSSTPAANAGILDALDPSCKIFGFPIEAFGNGTPPTKAVEVKSFEDGAGVEDNAPSTSQPTTDISGTPAAVDHKVPEIPERPSYTAFGTSFSWSIFNIKQLGGTCGMNSATNKAMNGVVNIMLSIYSMFASLALTVFGWAMNLNLFDMFKNAIVEVIHNLHRSLYLEYLTPLIIIAALWIGWNGIVKRRNSQVTQGTVWLVAAISLTFVFFKFPATFIVGTNRLVQGISLQVMMTVAGVGNKSNEGTSLCKTSLISQQLAVESKNAEKNGPVENKTLGDYQTSQRDMAIAAQCLMWETFYYEPWALGQFGDNKDLIKTAPSPQKLTDWQHQEWAKSKADGDFTHWSSRAMGAVFDENGKLVPDAPPNPPYALSLPELYLMSTHYTQKETEAIHPDPTNYYEMNFENKARIDAEKRAERRDVMVWMTCGFAGGDDGTYIRAIQGGCPYAPLYPYIAGEKTGTQIGYIFLGWVSLLFAFTPLLIMAITLIFYSFVGIVLWMVLPFFLLIGIHPGFGRKLLLGWCEQIVSNFLKRIGVALMIGITLMLMEIALNISNIGLIAKAFLMCIIGVSVLLFKGKFVKMMSRVNFGGGGNPDAMGHELKRSGQKAAGRVAYTGGTSAGKFQNVREAGGGLGAATLAGLGGLAMGGVKSANMRHGGTNPARAGSYGYGQGRKGAHARKKHQKYASNQMEDMSKKYNEAENDTERRDILNDRFRPFIKRMKGHGLHIPRVAGDEALVAAGIKNNWLDEKKDFAQETIVPTTSLRGEAEHGGSDSEENDTPNSDSQGDVDNNDSPPVGNSGGENHGTGSTENSNSLPGPVDKDGLPLPVPVGGVGENGGEGRKPAQVGNNAGGSGLVGPAGGGGENGGEGRKPAQVGADAGAANPGGPGGSDGRSGNRDNITIIVNNDMQPLVDSIEENTHVTRDSSDRALQGLANVEQTARVGAENTENEVRNMADRTNDKLRDIADNTNGIDNAVLFSSIGESSSKPSRESSVSEAKIANAVQQGVQKGAEEGARRGAETGAKRGVQNFNPPPPKEK